VDVRSLEISAPLEDLRIHAVAAEQALCHAIGAEACQRHLELAVDGLIVSALVGDPAERA
jgi:hypothetical protein